MASRRLVREREMHTLRKVLVGELSDEYAEPWRLLRSMNSCITGPLTDPRWEDLVTQHVLASQFHQRRRLQDLYRTYGYKPFVLTSARPGSKGTENGLGHSTCLNPGVLGRIALWTEGCGTRLLRNDVALSHSGYA